MSGNENKFFTANDKQRIKAILSNSENNHGKIIKQLEEIILEKSAKLKINSKKYKFLLNNANDFICIINSDGKFEYINNNLYYNKLNYTSSELIGETVLDFIHPSDRKKVLNSLKEGVSEGKSTCEFRFKNKNGEWRWMKSRGSSFKDYDGEIKGIVVSKDITDKKTTALELRESELKYRTLIENLFDVVMIINLKGKIQFISPQIKPNFGYDREKLLGHGVFEFIHPKDLPRVEDEYKKLLKREKSLSAEYRARKKDGEYIWVKSKGRVVKFGNKKSIIGTMRNIDDKKKALTKLEETKEKYKDIAELLPDMIYEANRSKRITYLNSAGYEMLRYNKKDLREGIKLLDILDETYKEKGKENIKKLLNGEELEPHKYLMVRSDGSTFYAWVNSRPIYKEGKIVGLRGTISNINEMILAQKKIEKSEEKLQKLNRLKSELLRRTSHELKTPLVSIKGFTNLLLELNEDDLNQGSIKLIHEIKQGCTRLEDLINDILKTAKLESRKMEINKKKLNLFTLVRNAVKSLRGIAKSRKLSINLEINEDLPTRAEPSKIREVLENLILNAIKYTPSKGTIEVNSEKTKDDIIISIEDSGIGFTKEEKKDLFKQFGKIERYGAGHDVDINGSGLGLYISRKIIELHDGEIWMESEGRNKGSTFYFSLPLID